MEGIHQYVFPLSTWVYSSYKWWSYETTAFPQYLIYFHYDLTTNTEESYFLSENKQ